MKFNPLLKKATLVCRYKRFLADVALGDEVITVHCPNTGSMKNCIVEGSDCWILDAQNPRRKYRYSWELASTTTGHLAGINTQRANALIREALQNNVVRELSGYRSIKSEVRYGEKSRIDFLLANGSEQCFVEVKSVTFGMEDKLGVFPDAKSDRATKHLHELMAMKQAGHRAVLVFCVQHTGIAQVSPADEIDPVYGRTLRLAAQKGVEIIAYSAEISPQEITLNASIPVVV